MSYVGRSGEFDDVLEDAYLSGTVTVGTTEVEAKVGGAPLSGRELLKIQNSGNVTIYYGPTGVTTSTGIPIFKNQTVAIPVGEALNVYLISAQAGQTARVQELA